MEIKNYSDLMELSADELRKELGDMQTQYQKMRFDNTVKGMENPLRIRNLRRDIARVQTAIRQKEMELMSPDQLSNRSRIRARRAKQK